MTAEILRHVAYLLGLDLMVGGLLVFAYGVTGVEWFKSVFRAWDYWHAALFGGNGKHSISAYCGRAMLNGGPWVLVVIGALINAVFGALHCEDAARKEGLA